MWRAETADGGLVYNDWSAILTSQQMMYATRSVGGGLFIIGWIMMAGTSSRTAGRGAPSRSRPRSRFCARAAARRTDGAQLVFGKPVIFSALGLTAATMFAMPNIGLAVSGS
jgi:hypothetical protein